MNSIFIWSRDRACQSEALIRSIKKNIDDDIDIHLLFSYSDDNFKSGFDKLKLLHPDINFIPKQDGKSDLINIVKQSKITAVSTDDNFIFDKNPTTFTDKCEDVLCFSLRLGLNTIMQDHFNKVYQPLLNKYEQEEDTIRWNCFDYGAFSNYGYPYSTDMHFYRKDMLLPLLEQMEFNTPSQLEMGLCKFRDTSYSYMRSFNHSISVNVPLNCMSGNTESINFSNEDLNIAFLEGKFLNYIEEEIIGCHQNMGFNLK